MKISIITPTFNSANSLPATLDRILSQTGDFELETIVVDGGSTDATLEILARYQSRLTHVISEPDQGPADAINKGLRSCTGEVINWINADDLLAPGALDRVARHVRANPDRALCFGRCRIVDTSGQEIRRAITGFKEMFYPFSSRFTLQCINYISQPAMFFRRSAMEQAGFLRTDLKAAWDYEYVLRLWRHGGASRVRGVPLADFCWRPDSISGAHFHTQFQEELDVAVADAGPFSPQAWIHRLVRWGIVTIYTRINRPAP